MKKPICPNCGTDKVLPIAYGYPGPDLAAMARRGEVVLGGCMITGNDPTHVCQKCGHRFKLPKDNG